MQCMHGNTLSALHRKGKMAGKKRKERTPPDNEMTRKLRNRAEDADTSGREEGDQDGEGSDEDFDDGRPKGWP